MRDQVRDHLPRAMESGLPAAEGGMEFCWSGVGEAGEEVVYLLGVKVGKVAPAGGIGGEGGEG